MKGRPARRAMRPAALAALVFLAPALLAARQKPPLTYRIPAPPRPDFSSIEWMIGNWTGRMDKHSPPGKIQLSVAYGLDQRVMIFREKVSLGASGKGGGHSESSLGILSAAPAGNSYVMQVYTSTGFISRYRVSVSGSEIRFTPDGGIRPLPGWLSRRFIQRGDVDGFTEIVQLAPPMETFFNYYTAAFTRQGAPEGPKPESSSGSPRPEAGAVGPPGTAAGQHGKSD